MPVRNALRGSKDRFEPSTRPVSAVWRESTSSLSRQDCHKMVKTFDPQSARQEVEGLGLYRFEFFRPRLHAKNDYQLRSLAKDQKRDKVLEIKALFDLSNGYLTSA